MSPVRFIGPAFLVLLGALAVAPSGGCAASSTAADPNPIKCTPGNFVFCRCQNRAEGTKLCNEDGHSFQKCDPCETADNPALPDDPNHPPMEVDGGQDVVQPPVSATCGDAVVQDGEDCDDGNKIEDDGCDSSCHLAGSNPASSRMCPGLETHVWAKSVVYVGTSLGSTNTAGTPTCSSTTGGNPTTGAAAPDRVFKVVPHKTGTMTVTTSDVDYDSFIYVTDNCAPSAPPSSTVSHLACSNDTNGVGGETMTVPVTSGKAVSVFLDGAGTGATTKFSGAFRVTFAIQ